ncbi:hypothetical protein FSST1_007018 [Fusarium sambucinum]
MMSRDDTSFKIPEAPPHTTSAPSTTSTTSITSTTGAHDPLESSPHVQNWLQGTTPQTESSLESRPRESTLSPRSRQPRQAIDKVGRKPPLIDAHEPNSTRSHVEFVAYLKYRISHEKGFEAEYSTEQLTAIRALEEASDNSFVNYREKVKKLEKDEQALRKIRETYTDYERKLKVAATECQSTKDQLDKCQQATDDFITKNCVAHIEHQKLGMTDQKLSDVFLKEYNEMESPLKADLEEKSARKRKISEMFASLSKQRKKQHDEVKKAKKEMALADAELRRACKNEDAAAYVDQLILGMGNDLKEHLRQWDEAVKEGQLLDIFKQQRHQRHGQ